MRKTTLRFWVFLLPVATAALGCASDCGCGLGDTDADTNSDSLKSTDGNSDQDDTSLTASYASFCNKLTYGDGAAVMRLLIGTGSEQVILSANTNTCSNRLGEDCIQIPTGTAVPLVVQNETGQTQYTTQLDIEAGTKYMFYTNVDAGAVILEDGIITEALNCAEMECNYPSPNELTCTAADPCSWIPEGTYDSYCQNLLP